MTERTLDGLNILVLRPAEQAGPLCRMLADQGARVVRMAMQAIEPVRRTAQVGRALRDAREADAWIFTSANAVNYARHVDAGVWPACIAVGTATAAALARQGIPATVPEGSFSSEGVLALDALQSVAGHRYAVITGENGRDAIEAGLRARGAQVERIEVYRRVDLPLAPADVERALDGIDLIVVTNGESLRALLAHTPETARARLLGCQLVLPSRRVVEKASAMGFTASPLMPDQVADAAYLRCIERWRRT